MEKSPVASTCCSDPAATHTVNTGDPRVGYGIYGYYTSQMDAFRVRRFLLNHGCLNVSVEEYDRNDLTPKIHPLIEAHHAGLI